MHSAIVWQLEMIYLSEDIVGGGQNLNCAELFNRLQNYEGETVFNKIYELKVLCRCLKAMRRGKEEGNG